MSSANLHSTVRVMLPPSIAFLSEYSSKAAGVAQNIEQMFMSTIAE